MAVIGSPTKQESVTEINRRDLEKQLRKFAVPYLDYLHRISNGQVDVFIEELIFTRSSAPEELSRYVFYDHILKQGVLVRAHTIKLMACVRIGSSRIRLNLTRGTYNDQYRLFVDHDRIHNLEELKEYMKKYI